MPTPNEGKIASPTIRIRAWPRARYWLHRDELPHPLAEPPHGPGPQHDLARGRRGARPPSRVGNTLAAVQRPDADGGHLLAVDADLARVAARVGGHAGNPGQGGGRLALGPDGRHGTESRR